MPTTENDAIRLLVVARHPFQQQSLGLGDEPEVEHVHLIRRPKTIAAAIDESRPNLVLVDTEFPGGGGFDAIGEVVALAPEADVLALTPDPPPHHAVARAVRAGASGFIDVDAGPDEFLEALRATRQGMTWLPEEEMRGILTAVATDLDTTTAERRSRMTGIMLGLIPLTGLMAALLSFLWRKYLGQIGVRPVDLAIDPASRVIDSVVTLLLLVGVFGPLLFVGSWLDLLRESPLNRGLIGWLLERRRAAHFLTSLVVLAVGLVLALGPDLLLVLVIGPIVAISVIARSVDVTEELPRILRIERLRPGRAFVTSILGLVLFLGLVSAEGFLVGPDLRTGGEGGYLAARVLGFNAQPMRAFDVDSGGEAREVLYLGGNADLYVLVDPCNDDTVEMVSVGSTRLVVIDEVTCPAADDG